MSTLHVEPKGDHWVVRAEGAPLPLSEHLDATGATLAAQSRSRAQVLLHDRYNRVRPIPGRPRSAAEAARASSRPPGAADPSTLCMNGA